MSSELLIALIGAAATIVAALFSWFAAKRQFSSQKLLINIGDSEDISLAMRRINERIQISLDGQNLFNLNRAEIFCSNIGNSVVKNIRLRISLKDKREYFSVDTSSNAGSIRGAITVEPAQPNFMDNSTIIAIDFLNPRETLSASVYFSGVTNDMNIDCRLEDVEIIFRRGDPIDLSIKLASKSLEFFSLGFPLAEILRIFSRR